MQQNQSRHPCYKNIKIDICVTKKLKWTDELQKYYNGHPSFKLYQDGHRPCNISRWTSLLSRILRWTSALICNVKTAMSEDAMCSFSAMRRPFDPFFVGATSHHRCAGGRRRLLADSLREPRERATHLGPSPCSKSLSTHIRARQPRRDFA